MIIRIFSGLIFGSISLVFQLGIVAAICVGGYMLAVNNSDKIVEAKEMFMESEIGSHASELIDSIDIDKMHDLLENVREFELNEPLSRTSGVEQVKAIETKD